MKKILKIVVGIFLFFLIAIIGLGIYLNFAIEILPPQISDKSILEKERVSAGTDAYAIGNNWFRKNQYGLWEMYLEGSPYERGVIRGKLSKELIDAQEKMFVDQIKEIIPSESYLKFLKYMVAWFNRDIDEFVPLEYQQEIYGVSEMATSEYTYIGENYIRILNYHAAHDIGHALQDKNFVPGCTSFSVWGGRSKDSSLIIGRNFDFHVSEDFSKDKIICFMAPDSGYKFMFVTWGAMTGVVSGMNERGLTVTINASKSDFPPGSATPISILAREILQYAETIDQAYAIAQKRVTFVSESIMIGSDKDNSTAIIEKSPLRLSLYKENDQDIVCSNHYQSSIFNQETDIKERSSLYRYERTLELLNETPNLDVNQFAKILRDRKGKGGKDIGMGNEKALNQLIAHHAIIFQPKQRKVWVSSNPYQLGAFVCYDLNRIFQTKRIPSQDADVAEVALTIPIDEFLQSEDYRKFENYKRLKKYIRKNTSDKIKISQDSLTAFENSNPEFYYTYWIIGDYYQNVSQSYSAAVNYYQKALDKEVPRDNELEYLNKNIKLCQEKLN